MNNRHLLHALFIAAAVSGLAYLYTKVQAYSPARHAQITSQLRQLKHYDAALNQDVLNVRSGLLQHYDPLVQTTLGMAQLIVELQDSSAGIVGNGNQDLDQLVKQYSQLFTTRSTMVERFKAKNSILKNSLFYFPTAAALFVKHAQAIDAAGDLSTSTEKLLQDLLSFYVNGNPDIQARVQSHIHGLSELSDEAPEGLERELTGLVKHASIVLWHKKEVDELLRRITSAESSAVADSLNHVYQAQYLEAQGTVELYRAGLYVGVTLLLCYIAFFLFAAIRDKSAANSRYDEIDGPGFLASQSAA